MTSPRVLVVTRLFPNAAEPLAAPFNRRQMVALARLCPVEVLGVLPWFPGARFAHKLSAAARTVDVPREEIIDGLQVRHPRALYLPRVGLALAPLLYAGSVLPDLVRLRAATDVVLACWAYPDGVAAVALGRLLGLPVVVKVHGTDVNDIIDRPAARPWARRLLPAAARVIAVSRPLAQRLSTLGVPAERVVVVENGVDRGLFRPRDRQQARASLGVPPQAELVLYVGALKASKGALDTLTAFAELAPRRPRLALAMVGGGEALDDCKALSARFPGRVFVTGALPPGEVAHWLGAADLLTLPSWNEGTPNVVLEALASGRPVVASAVGGIPDVLRAPVCGRLVPARDTRALAQGWQAVLDGPVDAEAITGFAPADWAESGARLHAVLAEVARG